MGITVILRRIWLFSANKIKSFESFSKQPTQLIVELNWSLRHIIVTLLYFRQLLFPCFCLLKNSLNFCQQMTKLFLGYFQLFNRPAVHHIFSQKTKKAWKSVDTLSFEIHKSWKGINSHWHFQKIHCRTLKIVFVMGFYKYLEVPFH